MSGFSPALVSQHCPGLLHGHTVTIAKRPRGKANQRICSQVKLSGSTVVGPVAGRDINIDTFVQQGIDLDTPKDEYHSTPTAADIGTTIRQASLYLQPTVARSYDGLRFVGGRTSRIFTREKR